MVIDENSVSVSAALDTVFEASKINDTLMISEVLDWLLDDKHWFFENISFNDRRRLVFVAETFLDEVYKNEAKTDEHNTGLRKGDPVEETYYWKYLNSGGKDAS